MPMTPDDVYAHAMHAVDEQGRLPLSRMTGWEIFPFEQASLRVIPLPPPELPEPARAGEGGPLLPGMRAGPGGHLVRRALAPVGVPAVRAIESLPHIARPCLPLG